MNSFILSDWNIDGSLTKYEYKCVYFNDWKQTIIEYISIPK